MLSYIIIHNFMQHKNIIYKRLYLTKLLFVISHRQGSIDIFSMIDA